MLIKSLSTHSGQTVQLGRATAFLGTTNTGKSVLLQDILRLLTGMDFSCDSPPQQKLPPGQVAHRPSPPEKSTSSMAETRTVVLQDIDLDEKLSQDQLLRGLKVQVEEAAEETRAAGLGPLMRGSYDCTVRADAWHVLRRPKLDAQTVRKTPLADILPLRVAYLDPQMRSQSVASCPAISPADRPQNMLQALEQSHPAIHEELSETVYSVLGQQLRLDATRRVELALRIGKEFPELSEDPAEAVRQLAKIPTLDDQGDGCRSLVAIVLGVLLAEGRAVLVDQPEAFLHPIQARKLGAWLGQCAQRLYCQILVSTHSTAFLAGLLSTSSDVTIVRLTRQDRQTSLHPIAAEIARELAQSPISSIQPVLDCLFYCGVVIAKADADRAIYQTVAHRYFDAQELTFIQAYGKRNLAYVTKLLRSAGIPACVVADLDILESKSRFAELVDVVTGEPPLRAWMATRDKLATLVEGAYDSSTLRANTEMMEQLLERLTWGENEPAEEGRSPKIPEENMLRWAKVRHGGLAAIPEDLRPWVEDILVELKPAGLFIVPGGELESWMDVGVSRQRKQEWFIKAVYALRAGDQPQQLIQFVGEMVSYLRQQWARISKG